jgi:hypothetical protein
MLLKDLVCLNLGRTLAAGRTNIATSLSPPNPTFFWQYHLRGILKKQFSLQIPPVPSILGFF